MTDAQNARLSGNYAQAEKLYLAAIHQAEKSAELHPFLYSARHDLAEVYKEQGRYAEAEEIYVRQLTTAQDSPQPNTGVHSGHMSLALLFQDQGKYPEAETHFMAALAETEKPELWPNDAPLASTSMWVASCYIAQRRYAEAEPFFRRTLGILERDTRPDSALAHHLQEFAKFYQDQANYDAAEALYKRAVAASESCCGPDDVRTVHALYELAGFYRATGRHAQAETNCRRALAIAEKTAAMETAAHAHGWTRLRSRRRAGQTLIPSHQSSVSTALDRLAEVYEDQHRYSEAEPLRRRSLEIKEKFRPGIYTAFLVDDLETYAVLLRKMGRDTQAAEAEARARPLRARYPKGSYRCQLRATVGPMKRSLRWRLSTFMNVFLHPSRYGVR